MAQYLYCYSKQSNDNKFIKYTPDDIFLPKNVEISEIELTSHYKYDIKNFKFLAKGGFNVVLTDSRNPYILFRLTKKSQVNEELWNKLITEYSFKVDKIRIPTVPKPQWGLLYYIDVLNNELGGLFIQRKLYSQPDLRSIYICGIEDYGVYNFGKERVGGNRPFIWPIALTGLQHSNLLSPLGVYARIEYLEGYSELTTWIFSKFGNGRKFGLRRIEKNI